jgi:hypothetical protein
MSLGYSSRRPCWVTRPEVCFEYPLADSPERVGALAKPFPGGFGSEPTANGRPVDERPGGRMPADPADEGGRQDGPGHQAVSASASSRTRAQQPLSRRETCIWEMPSWSAMRLWVIPRK